MAETVKPKASGVKATALESQQQKILQLQVLQSYAQTIQQQAQQVSQKIQELAQSKQALEDLKNVKPADALIPIGSGSYIFGKVSEPEQVLVTFGAGVAVKKTREDAFKLTDSRIADLQKILNEISMQGNLINAKMQELQSEFQQPAHK